MPAAPCPARWARGLLPMALAPVRAGALLARAQASGQSRMVCGVHWQSGVAAGRAVGAAAQGPDALSGPVAPRAA